MKSKTFLISGFMLFALVTLVSLASADIAFVPSSLTTNVHPGQDVTITFQLNNTGTTNYTSINWNSILSTADTGLTWKQFPNSASLREGEIKSFSAIISASSAAQGSLNANLHATTTPAANADLPVTINVASVPALRVTEKTELTKDHGGVIKIENIGNVDVSNIILTSSGAFSISFDPDTSFNLAVGASKEVNINSSDLNDLKFGDNTVVITATGSGNVVDSENIVISNDFCKAGEKGNILSIDDVTIDNKGSGDDDEWNYLDVIEVEVKVENTGSDDVDDVIVKLGLFDSSGKNQIGDLDFENDEEEAIEVGDINDGKDETVTFTFKISPDLADGNYKLAIKAYGDKLGESNICTDKFNSGSFETVSIDKESDAERFIAFDNIVLAPSEATCGDTVTLNADVWNIGDEDQDQVKIALTNTQLGINTFAEIKNDLNQGDKDSVSLDFTVPSGLADKIYDLTLNAQYDYRNGNYRESLGEPVRVPIRIFGCTPTQGKILSISAVLDSEAKAGKELVVKATITNLDSKAGTFAVDAEGYSSWAELTDISDETISLGSGESQDVTFKFNVDADASGEQDFDIRVGSESRKVSVNLAESGAGFSLGNNSLLWVIGIINVILIVLIIIVAVRIARR